MQYTIKNKHLVLTIITIIKYNIFNFKTLLFKFICYFLSTTVLLPSHIEVRTNLHVGFIVRVGGSLRVLFNMSPFMYICEFICRPQIQLGICGFQMSILDSINESMKKVESDSSELSPNNDMFISMSPTHHSCRYRMKMVGSFKKSTSILAENMQHDK